MKFTLKRILSFILALGMIFAMVPELGIEADAATLTGLTDTGIGLEYKNSDISSGFLVSAGSVSWKASANTVDGSIKGSSSFGQYFAADTTLTVTNNSTKFARISFDYTATFKESGESFLHINGTQVYMSVKEGDTFTGSYSSTADVASGETLVTIKLTAGKRSGDNTATIKITNVSLDLIEKGVSTTFEANENCAYTVTSTTNGENTVSSAAVTLEQPAEEKYTLKAQPGSGYVFFGWKVVETGAYLSYSTEAEVSLSENYHIVPVVVADTTALFGVGSQRFFDLNDAATVAANGSTKTIVLLNNGTLPAVDGGYTIPTGVTLLIPFDSANTCYTIGGNNDPKNTGLTGISAEGDPEIAWTQATPYRTLTMASGASITINGVLSVSAKHTMGGGSKPFGGLVSGPYGHIAMESGSNITVASGGVLYAWGYITGRGSVTAQNGAKVYEYLQVADFRGGSATGTLVQNKSYTNEADQEYNKVFPFSQYYLQNIEVPLTLYNGAEERVFSTLYMGETEIPFEALFVGKGSGLFRFSGEDASDRIIKRYDGSKDRLVFDVYGNMTMSNLQISFDRLNGFVLALIDRLYGFSGIDSAGFVFPVTHNITMNIHSGTTTIDQNMALLPGCELVIDKGATISVNGGKEVFIYDRDEWMSNMFIHSYGPAYFQPAINAPGRSYNRTEADLKDAKVVINGTLNVGGTVYTTNGGAEITSTGGGMVVLSAVNTSPRTYTLEYAQGSSALKELGVTLVKLYNSAFETDATVDKYTVTAGDAVTGDGYIWENGVWKKVTATITFDANSPGNKANGDPEVTGSIADATVSGYVIMEGGYAYKLPDSTGFTAANYEFDGWAENSDGTGTIYEAGANVSIEGDTTYYAQWIPKQYTITFNTDGGTAMANITKNYGEAVTISTPTKNGYTFTGWVDADSGAAVTAPTTMPSGGLKLKATWTEKQVSIHFDTDGGNTIAPITGKYDSAITQSLPTPIKTGYTFTGWVNADNEPVAKLPDTMPAEDMTLKATWQIKTYTIQWDTDGDGNVNETSEDVTYNSSVSHGDGKKESDVTGVRYEFAGWSDGKTTYGPDAELPNATADVTYTAIFKTYYTITWVVEDVTTTTEAETGTSPVYSGETPSKEDIYYDYTFAGWKSGDTVYGTDKTLPAAEGPTTYTAQFTSTAKQYTITFVNTGDSTIEPIKQAYDTAITAPGDPVWEGHEFLAWDPAIPTTMPAENVTITAQWKVLQYTVTFDTGDGSPDENTQDYGTAINLPANPSKTGYSFNGWKATKEDGTPIDTVPTTVPAYDVTITAQWKVNSYNVTIDHNNGTEATTSAMEYGAAINLPTNLSKTGYSFNGWKATKEDGTPIDDVPTTVPAYDVTITAQWKLNEYTITFNTDGGSTIAPIEQDYGTAVNAPKDPTKTGYQFTGWVDTEGKPTTVPKTMPAGDLVLTATWTVKQYTITFLANKGDETAYATITQDYGTAVTAPANPTKTGYNFVEWDPAIPATMPAENVTITAKWDVNQYTITFNVDDNVSKIITEDYGTPITENMIPANPEKEGYTFGGWYDGENLVTFPTTMPAKNMTLTAKWQIKEYTITFETDSGNTIADATKDYNTTMAAPSDSKTGYTFLGWAEEPNGDVVYEANAIITFTENLTLYAKWQINQYKVTFITDSGNTIAALEQDYNTTMAAPSDSKTGYTFLGWAKSADGEVVYKAENTITFTEDLTLHAKWQINQYSISFNTEGGSEVKTITANYGEDVTAPDAPTKEGHEFLGWVDVTTDTAAEIPETMPAYSMELKAVWKLLQYTITFANTGDTTINAITADYGTAVTAPENPEKEGHTFAGWDVKIPATMPAENITVTANWTVNAYTITFDSDGGSAVAGKSVNYGEAIVLTEVPTKEGHEFAGWKLVKDDALVEVPATMPASNLELKATWNVKSYTLTIDVDGETTTKSVEYGKPISADEPSKEGHTFAGWTATKTEGGPAFDKPATMPAYNVTLTATWTTNSYIVTIKHDNGTTDTTNLMLYGADITLPDVKKEGYTFAGWTAIKTETTQTVDVPETVPAYDVTITAQWEINTHTFTYIVDGVKTEHTVEYGATIPAMQTPTKVGYTFKEWSPAVPSTMPDKDVEVVAQWTINQYTINFVTDSGNTIAAAKQNYNTTMDAPADSKTGHTFLGWATSEDGAVVYGADDEITFTEDLTLYAKWQINTYTFKYIIDDVEKSDTLDYGAKINAPADPEKEGHKFAGWSPTIPATMPAENVTVTATWTVNEYTVTFDSDGGSAVAEKKVAYGAAIELPAAPTKEGHEFAGWKMVAEDNSLVDVPANMPAGNVTLKATWNVNSYTISYFVDGVQLGETETYAYNATIVLPTEPTKDGYDFGGWVYKDDASKVLPKKMPAQNLEVVAMWRDNERVIFFNPNGAEGFATTMQTVKIDASGNATANLNENAFSRTGYTFAGWAENEDGSGAQYADKAEVNLTDDLTLYAQWTINSYTLTTVVNNVETTQTVEYNAAVSVDTPNKLGHTFAGWAATKTEGGDEISVPANMPAYDVTLTATWTTNSYNVTFDSDGGSTVAVKSVKFGDPIVLTEVPTKEGHEFAGWKLVSGAELKDVPANMPAYNVTLKATWTVNSYEITFVLDEGNVQKATFEFGAAVVAPTGFTKEGHTFADWDVAIPATMPAKDMTITAKWTKNNYKVTINLDNGTEPVTTAMAYGDAINLPAAEKTGYSFVEWTAAKDNGSEGTVPTTVPAYDVTITATWQINQYTITFDTDGGTEIDPIKQDYNTAVKEPADPTKEGYTFRGWNGTIPTTMPAKDTALKALWEINSYTISFENCDNADITAQYGADVTINTPTKTGYTFAGWTAIKTGTTTEVDVPAKIPAYNVTLTANWTAEKHSITFNTDGGSAIAPIVGDYGTAVTAPKDPTKTGYQFTGWVDTEGKPTTVPKTMPAGDLVLKATWKINQYTITFKDTDGSVIGTITKDYNTAITADMIPEAPEKTGHTFVDWDKDIPEKMPAGNMTITAQWTVNKYKFTVIVDGTKTEEEVAYGAAVTKPADPSKNGYGFAGWDGNIPATMPAEDVTITATWTVNEYSVSYNLDGGALEEGKSNPTSYTIESADFTLTNPTKEGYTFAGWTGTDLSGATETVTVTNGSTGNRTYTATWTVNNYTVRFESNGGTAVDDMIDVPYGTEIVKPAEPTKEGYIFGGWDKEIPATVPAENLVITAKWVPVEYTITFDTDGGSAVADIKAGYETSITAPTDPTKPGHTFTGWEDEAGNAVEEFPATMPLNGMKLKATWDVNQYTITFDTAGGTPVKAITQAYGTAVEAPENPTREGYRFISWNKSIPTTMPAEDVTITAIWQVERYTIRFETDGGTAVAPITAYYGTDITAPANPEKTGYTFAGWDKEIPATMPAGGMTIKATWTAKEYTITLDTNGDGTAETTIKQPYNTDVTAADPEKEGYTFAGWYNGDSKVTFPIKMPVDGLSLTAKWTANQYTITFVSDGKTYVQIKQAYGTDVTAPADPTKTGYSFDRWDQDIPETMPAGDMTITAKWTINQYTISFDSAGGTTVNSITQAYGTAVTAPTDPTKTGYKFQGWYQGDTKVVFSTMPAENVTYTARWQANRYTIRFVTGGGTAVDPITADYNAPVAVPADPTRTGYTFAGWDQEVPETMPLNGMTITAKWTPKQYIITFDTDGGTAVESITADYNSAVLAPEATTKEGYEFAGWYNGDNKVNFPVNMPLDGMSLTAKWTVKEFTITFMSDGRTYKQITQDYGTDVTAPADPVKTGYTFIGWDVRVPGTMPAGNMTITAQWTINEYSIKLDADGDGEADTTITQNYGTAVTAPADPEKTGYTFGGWVDAQGSAAQIPETMPAEEVVLTAKWTINQYTVTFDTDGGSAVDAVTKDYGEQIEEPAAPTKEGHTFTGWVDANGEAVTFPITVDAQNSTIKASWKANTYTITFNTDGGSEVASITQDYGTAITAPAAPVKEGYSFAGWDIRIPATMPAGDMTITARWTINRYTITFADTGDTTITPISRPYGAEIIAPADPVKEGHTFLGWDQEIPTTMPAGDMTITAQWQINQYTISFKDCDKEAITADYGTVLNIEDPTREGYTFDGWNNVVPATMPAQDMELTARWVVNKYTITFNTAGGDELDPITQDYGTPINFTTSPEREGYTFITWSPELPKTMPAEDMTVTAIWTLDTYTITFDTAGGSKIDPIVQQYGKPVTAPADPTREGYVFDGWDIEIPETMPAENLTITASWKPANFTITFVSDGIEVGSVTAEYGSKVSPVNAPSKTGYDFAGWEPEIPATMPSYDLVINAKWTPKQYTLHFDTNGGNEMPAQTLEYGAKIEAPADPVREGYIFTGWNMDVPETMPAENLTITASWKIGSFAIMFDTDGGTEVGEIVQNYGTPINAPEDPTRTGYTFVGWEPEIPTTMPGQDMTIKAVWKAKQYTMSFNTEGGSEIAPITADYGSAITAPAAPTKDGYTFMGWDKKIPATMPARNMTFNAVWEEGHTGWLTDDMGITYVKFDEKAYFSTWATIDGKDYYFNQDGYVITGISQSIPAADTQSNAQFVFDDTGALRKDLNGLYEHGQATYLTEEGQIIAYAGLVKIGEDYYYFDESNTAVKNGEYEVIKHNDLMAAGVYCFDEMGRMILPADLFEISFANMTLGNSLKMNFAFEQGHLDDWTGHYATVRKTYADGRGDVVATMPYEQWTQTSIGGKAYFITSFNGIAAKEMTDEVYVTIFNAEGEAVSHVWEDSVRSYAMRTLNNSNHDEQTHIMIVDMLNYGAAAQNYFGYNTEDLANNQLSEEQAALATDTVTYSDSRVCDDNYRATQLVLESQILLRVAFKEVTGNAYATISFTSHTGKDYEITVNSDELEQMDYGTVVSVDEIVVADGRCPITITLYNEDGTVFSSVTDSMESYIARSSDSDVLYELIMKFSDSAYNFFH